MLFRFVAATLIAAAATAAAAAEPKREAVEKASDPQDKMICKRFVETGSLVKGYRSCKTKRDWERERDAMRQRVGSSTSCRSGDAICG